MGRLTAEERQRVSRHRALTPAQAGPTAHEGAHAPCRVTTRRRLTRALAAATIAAVSAGALLAAQAVMFELRGSLVETFLPRASATAPDEPGRDRGEAGAPLASLVDPGARR